MSLCPHGYTAFWDCPICEEPMGTARPDDRLCLCNHLESQHRLELNGMEWCSECRCTVFEWDPIGLPATPHSQHTQPVLGCDRCDDLLLEAREIQAERPWEDG